MVNAGFVIRDWRVWGQSWRDIFVTLWLTSWQSGSCNPSKEDQFGLLAKHPLIRLQVPLDVLRLVSVFSCFPLFDIIVAWMFLDCWGRHLELWETFLSLLLWTLQPESQFEPQCLCCRSDSDWNKSRLFTQMTWNDLIRFNKKVETRQQEVWGFHDEHTGSFKGGVCTMDSRHDLTLNVIK